LGGQGPSAAASSDLTDSSDSTGAPRLAPGLRDRSVLLISGLYDGELWVPQLPQLDHMHLPLYRALRAEEAPDVGFRLFMDEHAFAASRTELAESLLSWLRSCEAGTPCGG